jgi:hypothetical protein
MNNFWLNNPNTLLDNYSTIIPNNDMDRIEQMNTITRLIIYYIILCILFDSSNELILYGFIIIILIIVFYYIYKNDIEGLNKDLVKKNTDKIDKFTDSSCIDINNNDINYPMINLYDKHKNNIIKPNNKNNNKNTTYELNAGYLDSNGDYKLGQDYSTVDIKDYIKKDKKNKKVSWSQNQLDKQEKGRKPTVENPFNNIVFSDYTDSLNMAEPCNIDDKDVKEMQNLYNSTIFRNIDDVWERENSQRIFYTMPIKTVPNDQTNFANWLYKTGPSCKENSQNCTYYEDPTMSSPRY